MINKKTFCFDIDNTLCVTSGSNYKKSRPKTKMIKIVNQLFKNGHEIKIFTARYMGRNKDNQKKISSKMKSDTRKQLKHWGLKYHKLIFGKPTFDFIIDDKSIIFNEKKIFNFLSKYYD